MRHKTWFRLVIKAIGILLVGFSIPQVITVPVELIVAYVSDGDWTLYSPYTLGSSDISILEWLFTTASALGPILQFTFGLYLLFGGKWLVNKVIPSSRPYCAECGYDLSKSNAAKCPECGVAVVAGE